MLYQNTLEEQNFNLRMQVSKLQVALQKVAKTKPTGKKILLDSEAGELRDRVTHLREALAVSTEGEQLLEAELKKAKERIRVLERENQSLHSRLTTLHIRSATSSPLRSAGKENCSPLGSAAQGHLSSHQTSATCTPAKGEEQQETEAEQCTPPAPSSTQAEDGYTPLADPELEKARRELLDALRAATTPEGQARQLRSSLAGSAVSESVPTSATASPGKSKSQQRSVGVSPVRRLGLNGGQRSQSQSPSRARRVPNMATSPVREVLEAAWVSRHSSPADTAGQVSGLSPSQMEEKKLHTSPGRQPGEVEAAVQPGESSGRGAMQLTLGTQTSIDFGQRLEVHRLTADAQQKAEAVQNPQDSGDLPSFPDKEYQEVLHVLETGLSQSPQQTQRRKVSRPATKSKAEEIPGPELTLLMPSPHMTSGPPAAWRRTGTHRVGIRVAGRGRRVRQQYTPNRGQPRSSSGVHDGGTGRRVTSRINSSPIQSDDEQNDIDSYYPERIRSPEASPAPSVHILLAPATQLSPQPVGSPGLALLGAPAASPKTPEGPPAETVAWRHTGSDFSVSLSDSPGYRLNASFDDFCTEEAPEQQEAKDAVGAYTSGADFTVRDLDFICGEISTLESKLADAEKQLATPVANAMGTNLDPEAARERKRLLRIEYQLRYKELQALKQEAINAPLEDGMKSASLSAWAPPAAGFCQHEKRSGPDNRDKKGPVRPASRKQGRPSGVTGASVMAGRGRRTATTPKKASAHSVLESSLTSIPKVTKRKMVKRNPQKKVASRLSKGLSSRPMYKELGVSRAAPQAPARVVSPTRERQQRPRG